MRDEQCAGDFRVKHSSLTRLFLLGLLASLGSLGRLAKSQTLDCSAVSRSQLTSLNSLQQCVTSSSGASIVLDGSRRFVSPAGSPRQVLDLLFQPGVLFIPPGAVVEIMSAELRGIRLQPSPPVSLRLLASITVQPTATLLMDNVLLETDCYTLSQYQQWLSSMRPENAALSANGDIVFTTLRFGGIALSNCNMTCSRPTSMVSPLLDSSNSSIASNTTVLITNDLSLYNAFALAASYDPGVLTFLLSGDLTVSNPLWTAQPVTLLRSVTIIGASSNNSSADRKPILDLQDLTGGLYLRGDAVLSMRHLVIGNVGMVFGSAPVPYTGLGFVSCFLWFLDFPRIVSNNISLVRLRLDDVDIVSYPEDLEHMFAWSAFIQYPFGPLASLIDVFRIGVHNVSIDATKKPNVWINELDAYSMKYTDVHLVSSSTYGVNLNLTARRPSSPLYALNIPIMVTAVPIWTQADLHNALADAQRVTACSPISNVTTYLHVFSNISLDFTKWPGFNISCNITISGSLNREGGTWLNFNLLSRFITLTSNASLTFRAITLFNMPSQQRTYNLGDLTQMTLPLWPIGRPQGSSAHLMLQSCTIVLPVEEFRSVAVTLAVSDDGYISQALNAGVRGFQLSSNTDSFTATRVITVKIFDGLNMTAIDTQITDTSGYVPYSSSLGPNIYGTASLTSSPAPPPTSNPSLSSPTGSSGSLASSTIVAIAVAVPLGCIALGLAAWLVVHHRHRRNAVQGSADGRTLEALGTSATPSGAGARGVDSSRGEGIRQVQEQAKEGLAAATGGDSASPGGSEGNSPVTEQSGLTEAQMNQDKDARNSEFDSDTAAVAPPLHVELHQLILDFAREIEDKHLTIHDALGSGGFATVYRGTWRGIDVAVKVIEFQDRAYGNERLQARAMTEAAIAANIQHANIVTTYSYDIRPVQPNEPALDTPSSSTLLGIGPSPEGGAIPAAGSLVRRRSGSSDQSGSTQAPRMWKLYLIQEFCEVGSLRVALENRMLQTSEGAPNLAMILRLSLDVVRGLQHLHKKNIVHGDLTPGNILLKANITRPGHYTAKLADFGLSVKMNPAQTSVDNNRTGTPFYASPEVRQHGNLTKASDVYALGVVLWEMWHGRPCYQRVRGVKHYIHATGYPNFPPQCPPAYSDLSTRCMRRALEERPQLGDVHDTLRNLLGAAVGGSSSSAACSEVGTSGMPSYEWPFVLQMAHGYDVVMGQAAEGYASALGAGGCDGSTASSTRSVATPGAMAVAGRCTAGQGGGNAAAIAATAAVAAPTTNVCTGMETSMRAALDVDSLVAGGARPSGLGLTALAAAPGGHDSWPRGPQGFSRMHREVAGQRSLPQHAPAQHHLYETLAEQQLPQPQGRPQVPRSPDGLLRCVEQQQQQHGDLQQTPPMAADGNALGPLNPGVRGPAQLPGVGMAPIVSPLSRTPELAVVSASVNGAEAALQLQQDAANATTGQANGVRNTAGSAAQGPSVSISLNLQTADEFVSALGSRTEE